MEQPLAQPWDLILVSFSLNEAFEDAPLAEVEAWAQRLLMGLAPGGLLCLLEPASEVASVRLEALREALISAGDAFSWGPCLHAHACPLLAMGEGWCHEVRRWPIPLSLQYINRRMYRAIEVIKFSFQVWGRVAPPSLSVGGQVMRLISPMSRKKGRWLATGCAADGACWPLELPTRYLPTGDKALLKQLGRGDLIELCSPEALAPHPNTGLIRLPKGSIISRLEGACVGSPGAAPSRQT